MARRVKPEEIQDEPMGAASPNPFMEALRKVLLASIGAAALAQEEMEEFINRLIEKGELAEKDGKKLVNEIMDRRKKGTEKAEEEFNRRIETVLDRMNVPSKADIEALSAKISALSKKIEELKKS